MKNHKSAEAIALSQESYKNEVREEASQQGFDVNNVEVREGENHLCKPAQFVIPNVIDAETRCELLTALEQIKVTQLDLKNIKLSGKGRGLVFSFKNAFGHNTFVMLTVYSSRCDSSRSRIVSNIFILYLCLMCDIMHYPISAFMVLS